MPVRFAIQWTGLVNAFRYELRHRSLLSNVGLFKPAARFAIFLIVTTILKSPNSAITVKSGIIKPKVGHFSWLSIAFILQNHIQTSSLSIREPQRAIFRNLSPFINRAISKSAIRKLAFLLSNWIVANSRIHTKFW